MRGEQAGGPAGVAVARRVEDAAVFGGLVLPAGDERRGRRIVPPGRHADQGGLVAQVNFLAIAQGSILPRVGGDLLRIREQAQVIRYPVRAADAPSRCSVTSPSSTTSPGS